MSGSLRTGIPAAGSQSNNEPRVEANFPAILIVRVDRFDAVWKAANQFSFIRFIDLCAECLKFSAAGHVELSQMRAELWMVRSFQDKFAPDSALKRAHLIRGVGNPFLDRDQKIRHVGPRRHSLPGLFEKLRHFG